MRALLRANPALRERLPDEAERQAREALAAAPSETVAQEMVRRALLDLGVTIPD